MNKGEGLDTKRIFCLNVAAQMKRIKSKVIILFKTSTQSVSFKKLSKKCLMLRVSSIHKMNAPILQP